MHVLVAGDIAAGKSTAARGLAAELELPLFAERAELNPYVPNFYADPKRWCLPSQLHFLVDTFRQHKAIAAGPPGGVQDHSMYEVHEVYNHVLAADGVMPAEEYSLLDDVYAEFLPMAADPDVVVFLHAPLAELRRRIEKRGRPYESDVSMRYVAELADRRREFFRGWTRSPVISVDTAETDLRRPGQIGQLGRQIAATVRN